MFRGPFRRRREDVVDQEGAVGQEGVVDQERGNEKKNNSFIEKECFFFLFFWVFKLKYGLLKSLVLLDRNNKTKLPHSLNFPLCHRLLGRVELPRILNELVLCVKTLVKYECHIVNMICLIFFLKMGSNFR